MSRVTRAPFADVLEAVRARIVEVTELDDARVFITALDPDSAPRFGAAQDVLVRPASETPEAGTIDGAGRIDNRRKRRIEVTIRTRLLLDEADRDTSRLSDASLGHLALEDTVCDALELYNPTGEGDDAICLPLRVGQLSQPQRLRSDPSWVASTFVVEAEYLRDLDQTIL